MREQRPGFSFLFVVVFILAGCAAKEGGEAHDAHSHGGDKAEWREMDEFHILMAETFHPYKDSSNLEPARRMAGELMSAAGEWQAAPLPEKVDTKQMRDRLERLKEEATALAESARSADDNVMAERLTALHDTFHEIQEAWYRH